jgi:RNA polymerase sigma-70 factor (ECF subfamily)
MSTSAMSGVTSGPSEKALAQLFREHYSMLYRTAYSILDNPADAEEVPQTIFLRLLRRGQPPEMLRNPTSYLYRAAVNVSLNIIRARRRKKLTPDAENLQIPAVHNDSIALEDTDRRLSAAIAELPADAVEILILRYVHNHSDAEIATLLRKSRGTIAMKLFRARARLRKLMRSLGEQK